MFLKVLVKATNPPEAQILSIWPFISDTAWVCTCVVQKEVCVSRFIVQGSDYVSILI